MDTKPNHYNPNKHIDQILNKALEYFDAGRPNIFVYWIREELVFYPTAMTLFMRYFVVYYKIEKLIEGLSASELTILGKKLCSAIFFNFNEIKPKTPKFNFMEKPNEGT